MSLEGDELPADDDEPPHDSEGGGGAGVHNLWLTSFGFIFWLYTRASIMRYTNVAFNGLFTNKVGGLMQWGSLAR